MVAIDLCDTRGQAKGEAMNATTPFVFGLAAGATAVFLSCNSEVSRMEARQIRKENTATIDKAGLASQLLYENSDLMQQDTLTHTLQSLRQQANERQGNAE